MKDRSTQQTTGRELYPVEYDSVRHPFRVIGELLTATDAATDAATDTAADTTVRRSTRLLMRTIVLIIAILLPAVAPEVYATGGQEARSGDRVQPAPSAETRTITDGLGREVVIPADPRRIVTAGRAVLMTANVLWTFESAPDRVAGVGRITQGRGNFLPMIDPDYGDMVVLERNVGPEQVASLAPDLVILKSVVRSGLGEPLERLGIPVIYVDLENPEQYQRDLAVLGTAVREEERARELQRYFLAVTDRITEKTAALNDDQRPSTLLIYHRVSGGEVAFNVPPAGWMQTQLVEMAGGLPVWRDANPGGGWGTVSFEQIAAWDPEVIVLVEYDGNAPEIRSRLEDQPRWRELSAVRNNRFHAMPFDHHSWDQPDVRWLLGLQWTALMLQPGLFAGMDLDEAVREFYAKLYRVDKAAFDTLVAPTLTGDFPGGTP